MTPDSEWEFATLCFGRGKSDPSPLEYRAANLHPDTLRWFVTKFDRGPEWRPYYEIEIVCQRRVYELMRQWRYVWLLYHPLQRVTLTLDML
jgi:hypothetical protein